MGSTENALFATTIMLLLFPLLLSFANAQILFQQRIDDQEDFALNENFEEDFTSATERVVSDNPAEDTIKDTEAIRDSVAQTPTAIKEFEMTMNDFTQDFLTEVLTSDDNVVFSPFSLHTALAILTSGATDNSTTQMELLSALGRVQNIQGLELRYKSLLDEYLSDEVNQMLSFGNGFWTAKRYYGKINGRFLEGLSSLYQIDVQALVSRNPEAQINNWVKQQTQGKIDQIINFVSPDVAFLIVNALYFKAAWTVVFDKDPEPKEFTLNSGRKIQVPMMSRTSFHNYAAKFTTDLLPNMNFLALAIPYADQFSEDRFEMVILMPENFKGLDFLSDSLKRLRDVPDRENIFDVAEKALELPRLSRTEHIITMPSFNIDSSISVRDLLKKMGIVSAFDEGDFEGIVANEPIKLSDVKHRAKIEVTPDGTSGAAATAIELVSFAATFDVAREINIDSPFLFYIRDRRQKAILFAGKYSNPLN